MKLGGENAVRLAQFLCGAIAIRALRRGAWSVGLLAGGLILAGELLLASDVWDHTPAPVLRPDWEALRALARERPERATARIRARVQRLKK